MRTIGIVAEYNPFHSGHKHHLQAVRQAFGTDCPVVCAMKQGVDLVLELPPLGRLLSGRPSPWAGSACWPLQEWWISSALAAKPENCPPPAGGGLPAIYPVAKSAAPGAGPGLSFPAARQQAANALLGDTADCLRFPNNNLGVEYLRAIQTLKAPLTPHTIPAWG